MKRKIKFRAWDGEKMMYRDLHDRNWYTDSKGGKLIKGTHPSDAYMEIMEFTGQTDKNGKDIFESDLVQWEDWFGDEPTPRTMISEVVFEGGAFYPVCESESILFEIIGNIYSNPELIVNK